METMSDVKVVLMTTEHKTLKATLSLQCKVRNTHELFSTGMRCVKMKATST